MKPIDIRLDDSEECSIKFQESDWPIVIIDPSQLLEKNHIASAMKLLILVTMSQNMFAQNWVTGVLWIRFEHLIQDSRMSRGKG
jgi:hypothetical protein